MRSGKAMSTLGGHGFGGVAPVDQHVAAGDVFKPGDEPKER